MTDTLLFMNEYQRFTDKTAQYPMGMVYVTLGMIGELGELRDKMNMEPASKEEEEDLLYEAGDVFWYIARACQEMGFSLHYVISAAQGAGDDGVTKPPSMMPIENKWSEICRLAENVKKFVRDGKDVSPDSAFPALVSATKMVLSLCQISNIHYLDAMSANMKKLSSRLERGVIKGSGDRR
tara:strand:- start:222 stop:764 length:543 start_codon:yes stop_codon:yes gene_type:complete